MHESQLAAKVMAVHGSCHRTTGVVAWATWGLQPWRTAELQRLSGILARRLTACQGPADQKPRRSKQGQAGWWVAAGQAGEARRWCALTAGVFPQSRISQLRQCDCAQGALPPSLPTLPRRFPCIRRPEPVPAGILLSFLPRLNPPLPHLVQVDPLLRGVLLGSLLLLRFVLQAAGGGREHNRHLRTQGRHC